MKCQICRKESSQLEETLMSGPNGFRRYKVCPNCTSGKRKMIQPEKPTKGKRKKTA